MTAPSAGHHDGGAKYATGACKNRGRDWMTVGTWNVSLLRQDGKQEELAHEMSKYRWKLLGLFEMRWEHFGHFGSNRGRQQSLLQWEYRQTWRRGSFLVHQDIIDTVMGCHPVSSRLISIRLRASPFNITTIQVYAPTIAQCDEEVDEFYQKPQELIDQTPQMDVLIVHLEMYREGDWNATVGKDSQADWGGTCGPYCKEASNDRGLKLLKFAIYNNLVLTNTLASHKPSRWWTWHSPDGEHHNQIDYILITLPNTHQPNQNKKLPRSWHRVRPRLGDYDIQAAPKETQESRQHQDQVWHWKAQRPQNIKNITSRNRWKICPLTILGAEEMHRGVFTAAFNEGMTETASKILGKRWHTKKS